MASTRRLAVPRRPTTGYGAATWGTAPRPRRIRPGVRPIRVRVSFPAYRPRIRGRDARGFRPARDFRPVRARTTRSDPAIPDSSCRHRLSAELIAQSFEGRTDPSLDGAERLSHALGHFGLRKTLEISQFDDLALVRRKFFDGGFHDSGLVGGQDARFHVGVQRRVAGLLEFDVVALAAAGGAD